MDRRAWQATVYEVTRVRHDLVTKQPPPQSVIFSVSWLSEKSHIPCLNTLSLIHWPVMQREEQDWTQKHLTSKISSSVTLKFQRSYLGENNLFQNDFNHRRCSSLFAKEDFGPMWKHTECE